MQTCDSVLVDAMRAHLHKGVFAAGLHHLCKQGVEFELVAGGMSRRHHLCPDDVFYRREQSAHISCVGEETIKQGGDGGLAVSARHTHQMQLLRRIAVECRCRQSQRLSAVVDNKISHTLDLSLGKRLANNAFSAVFDGFRNVVVTVDLGAADCEKHAAVGALPRIELQVFCSFDYLFNIHIVYYILC